MKIYRCTHCGNIVAFLKDAGVPLFCCGQKMELLVPGSVDAAQEKHVPVAKVEGHTVEVTVGAVDHPMVPEHFIEWILLETNKGYAVHRLAALAGDGVSPAMIRAAEELCPSLAGRVDLPLFPLRLYFSEPWLNAGGPLEEGA